MWRQCRRVGSPPNRGRCWPSYAKLPWRRGGLNLAELTKIGSLARTKTFDRFTELTRFKIQYSEIVGRLSTKLRLTNQSRMSDRQATNAAQQPTMKPWDIGRDAPDDDREPRRAAGLNACESKTVLDLPGCQNSTICGISPHGGAQRHPFFAASSSIAVIATPIAAALSAASRLNQLSRINISIVQASYSTIAQRRPARTRAAWRPLLLAMSLGLALRLALGSALRFRPVVGLVEHQASWPSVVYIGFFHDA